MLKKKLTAMITLIAILVTSMSFSITAIAANDATATYTPITVNKVTDITMTSMVSNLQATYVDCSNITDEGTYNYYYTFKLDKPSYVQLETFAQIVGANYQGKLHVYLSASKIFNEEVMDTWMMGSNGSYTTFLEAGTYNVKLSPQVKEGEDKGIVDDKQLNLIVYAQETARSSNDMGYSKETAVKFAGTKGIGVFTQNMRTQWFKFTLDQKSDVTFSSVFTAPNNWSIDNYKILKLCDKNGVEICKIGEHGYNYLSGPTSFEKTVAELAAGTYYIEVTVGGSNTFKVDISYKTVDKYAPNKPKAINYKSGNKYIKGNAEKGTTVYVKYNGKTTKAKTDKYGVYKVNTSALKVGKKVQIWAKDAVGNKSAVTKVTIKNRQIAKPKIKTYKVNTKLVKGTAKKGTTVHVTYAGKTYKKKLKGASYSVKLNKKLVKGTAIKVKLVDNYGNYSKTVTVKIK